jgi:phosphoserine phosphatase
LHGEGKAQAVVELAGREGFDLAESTAYSDSHTDLPFLEIVGHPVVVNPDRELRRVARDRGWETLEFSERAYPHARRRVHPALYGLPIVLGALYAVNRRAR